MIIIHTDGGGSGVTDGRRSGSGSGNRSPGMGSTTTTTATTGGGGFRVVRPQRKDWVRFDTSSDSENEEDSLKNIEIDSKTNRLNLQLDLDNFESVEINLIKKRRQSSQPQKSRLLKSDVLVQNMEILRLSGFYYDKSEYNGETCTKLLSKTTPGTFLVRDSSDPNYLFTLSLQTERGPTSVRLVFWSTCGNFGEFRLDAADHRLVGALPGFKSVVELVQYYVEENSSSSNGNGKKKVERVKSGNRQVWIDSATGRTHSAVKLTTPLRQEVPSLKHLSRLALNKLNCDTIMLPEPVKKYLSDYPFVL